MAVKAKFEAPLQVVETEENRDRIKKIADNEEISQAQVIRELIAHGLEWREELSSRRGGPRGPLEGLE